MEFMAMRSLSRELPTVLSRLQRDGELVVTNNGQPTILMIDLVGKDLVDVVGRFRESKGEKMKAQQQNEALKHLSAAGNSDAWLKFVKEIRAADEVISSDYDYILEQRVNFDRELDL